MCFDLEAFCNRIYLENWVVKKMTAQYFYLEIRLLESDAASIKTISNDKIFKIYLLIFVVVNFFCQPIYFNNLTSSYVLQFRYA